MIGVAATPPVRPAPNWRISVALTSLAVGLGAALGAVSAAIDTGPMFWVMAEDRSGIATRDIFGVGFLFAPIGAFVVAVVGLVAGLVAAMWTIEARRRMDPAMVAVGIRARVIDTIVVFTSISTLLAVVSHMRATFVQELLTFGLIPGTTALFLAWWGSGALQRAYLRIEARGCK